VSERTCAVTASVPPSFSSSSSGTSSPAASARVSRVHHVRAAGREARVCPGARISSAGARMNCVPTSCVSWSIAACAAVTRADDGDRRRAVVV
jgi:hypothetical protein